MAGFEECKALPADLMDEEWRFIQSLPAPIQKRRRKPTTDVREVLGARVRDFGDDAAKRMYA